MDTTHHKYLRTFRHSFIVKESVDRVWDFYTDIKHLEIITPDTIDLKIINTINERIVMGQEIWISGKIITKIRSTWHSKITLARPFEYVDEMLTGPFKKWKHSHKFYKLDGKQTEIDDTIEFDLPYGILGKLFEGYAYKQIQKIFEHRKIVTLNALEKK